MIRIVTDSASMLPASLQQRFGIDVVAITITIDGDDLLEGVELSPEDFYTRLEAGADVATAAPAPGTFADVYRAAGAAGASAVLSIHTGSAYSATVGSATVAAGLDVGVPVTVVDTGVASFPVALAVWAAADRLAAGDTIDAAEAAAAETAVQAGSLFVVGVPEVARRGGRLVTVDGELTPTSVLELVDGGIIDHGPAGDVDGIVRMMIERTLEVASRRPLRVGVGHAVREDIAQAMVDRLDGAPGIREVTTYQVGPSVGAHTGAGTFGVVYAPAE